MKHQHMRKCPSRAVCSPTRAARHGLQVSPGSWRSLTAQRWCPGASVTAVTLWRAPEEELEESVNTGGNQASGNSLSGSATALRMSEGFGAIIPGWDLCSTLTCCVAWGSPLHLSAP